MVFDIIYLNGEPLYDRPLLERRILLEKHIADVPGRLHIAPHHVRKRREEKERPPHKNLNFLSGRCVQANAC